MVTHTKIDEARLALRWPASKKRHGTKSWEVG
jgi:hypothetical protein